MSRIAFPLTLLLSVALAACGGGTPAQLPEEEAQEAAPVLPPPLSREELQLTPSEREALSAPSCRDVVRAYSAALERNAFEFASRFWDDPVIDGERLTALHEGYVSPRIDQVRAIEDPADNPVICSVTGALIDASNSGTEPRQGELTLRRLSVEREERWVIVESTFVEPMQRAGRGEPA